MVQATDDTIVIEHGATSVTFDDPSIAEFVALAGLLGVIVALFYLTRGRKRERR